MALIDIVRVGGIVRFSPVDFQAAANDFVVWRNSDPESDHWPTPQGQPQNTWFDFPLPKFVAGQPAAVSDNLALPGGPFSVKYQDALDSSLQGTITIPGTT